MFSIKRFSQRVANWVHAMRVKRAVRHVLRERDKYWRSRQS